MKLRIFASSLLLAAAAFLAAPASVTGFWVLKIPTGDGNFRETFFDLKQDGDTVTGTLVGGRGGQISEGTFKDGKLKFTITPPQGRGPAGGGRGFGPTVYEGTWQAGKFAMTIT